MEICKTTKDIFKHAVRPSIIHVTRLRITNKKPKIHLPPRFQTKHKSNPRPP